MKLPYSKEPCIRHSEFPAEICPKCHSSAIGQRSKQWREESERAHAEYLARMARQERKAA